jgi:hypothetical protein
MPGIAGREMPPSPPAKPLKNPLMKHKEYQFITIGCHCKKNVTHKDLPVLPLEFRLSFAKYLTSAKTTRKDQTV